LPKRTQSTQAHHNDFGRTNLPRGIQLADIVGTLGTTLIARCGGRQAALNHFGIEVEDLERVRAKVAKSLSSSGLPAAT